MTSDIPKVPAGPVVINPVEDPNWNERLASHPQSCIFHSAGWAAALSETYGFKPQYLLEQEAGKIKSLLPLMEVKNLRGQPRAVSLPFTDSCPILLPAGSSDREWANQFLSGELPDGTQSESARLREAARALARERRWTSLEFRPPNPGPSESAHSKSSIEYFNHEVPVAASDAAQLAQCESATRRNIRQAQESNLPIRVGTELGLVEAYYRLHCITRRRQGAPPQPWQFFLNLQRHLLSHGLGFIVMVGQIPVAGALFLKFGPRAVYKFGASDGRLLDTRPNQRVMWTALRHAANFGCLWMDLGRTSLGNEGLRRFKQGWGSLETRLCYQSFDLKMNCLRKLNDRTGGWQARCFRALPSWASRWIGQIAYRFAA